MSLTCPKCEVPIKVQCIKENFSCPSCGSALEGNVNGPFLGAIVLSTIADLIIYPFVYSLAGTDWWPGIALRIFISGAVFISLGVVLMEQYGSVKAKDETQPLR